MAGIDTPLFRTKLGMFMSASCGWWWWPSGGVSAVDGQRMSDAITGQWTTQPEHRVGDFFGATDAPDGYGFDELIHACGVLGDHAGDHGGVDGAGADGVDADAAGGVFESCALGEAEDAVFGAVVDRGAGYADQPSDGGAVHDRAAAMVAHVAQFVFHARPDAPQVDGGDAVELVWVGVGGFDGGAHDTGVVEGGVEAADE